MSFEGLWWFQTTSVQNPQAFQGGGVVVLETGRVLGGDSVYSYVGNFAVDAGVITATVRVRQYNPHVVAENVFGMVGPVDYMVTLTGIRDPNDPHLVHGELR